MSEELITDAMFKKLIWNLNPSYTQELHNYSNTKYICEIVLAKKIELTSGEILNIGILSRKLNEYIINWQRTIGARDPKYLGKKDQIKTIYEYIDEKLFMSDIREVPIEADPRYNIIFGGVPEEKIREQFVKFRKVIE